jgi:hypothetical protein
MNTKKLIGYAMWLLAFLIPFQYALLSTDEVGNMTGLFSFIALLVLFFVGYALVDSADSAKGDHAH